MVANLNKIYPLGKKNVGATFALNEPFRNFKFMQVDLIQSNSILGSFVTTTNLKIDRKIQFSASVGETGNGSVFFRI